MGLGVQIYHKNVGVKKVKKGQQKCFDVTAKGNN